MFYIKNPAGRIIELDDEGEATTWLKKSGFNKPSESEVVEYKRSRSLLFESVTKDENINHDRAVHLVTVGGKGKDGYGVSSKVLQYELQALGLDVRTEHKSQKVGLLYHAPYSIASLETPFRVVYTMFESDKIPDDWKFYLDAADLVIVPSKWCQEVFAKSGIKSVVVPLGFDDEVYRPINRPPKADVDPFVFLHYNAFNVRKGFLEVFKAFTKAFDKLEPVKLVLKTTLEWAQIPLPITKEKYPNIEIIAGAVEGHEMRNILTKSDCFVFPSRGEGFGLTPLEAMATGIPAIVPNAHGISEYFNTDYMYEVKIAGKCPALYTRYKGQDVGEMVVCDVDDLARKMRYVYDHREEAAKLGQKAAKYAQQWTAKKTAEKLKGIIDDFLSRENPKKPLVDILPLELVA